MINLLIGISNANNHLLKEQDIDKALNACISSLGESIGIDRCYIFTNYWDDDELKLQYSYEWSSEGTESYIDMPELSGHTYDMFPTLYDTLIQDKPMYGLVKDIENDLFNEIMTIQGIQSFLFTPIFSDGEFWGWIGFDDCKTERVWRDVDVYALHTVAKNIGIRLNQDKARNKLENALTELNFYMKSSNQAKWELLLESLTFEYSYNWFDILGYDKKDLPASYHKWKSMIHPDDVEKTEKKLSDCIQNKTKDFDGIYRMMHKKGHYVWIKFSGIKYYNEKGIPIKIVGTHIDVSEIKEKEILLAKQRNEYDLLVNNLAEVIFKITYSGKIIFLNKQWETLTGYSIKESLGKNLFGFLEFKEEKREKLSPSDFEDDQAYQFSLYKKSGHKIWVILLMSTILDEDDNPVIIGSLTDINDEVIFKRKLEVTEKKFRFIAENTSDLIVLHNNKGIVQFISEASREILGYEVDEMIFQNPYRFIHPDDIKKVLSKHKNIFNNPKEIIVIRFKHKSGKYIWLEIYAKTLYDDANNIIGILTSSRDVTDRIRIQEETKQTLLKERELNEMKTGFVSMASHQFRTPLTVIYSNIELLNYKLAHSSTEVKKEIKKISERVFNEIDRMTELMNNILIFGKFESGKITKTVKPFNFVEYIHRLKDTYFNHEKDKRKLDILCNGEPRTVHSDESLLTHVLTNLISNAFKFSEGKKAPILHIHFLETHIEISVTDFGIGIPEEDQENLFKSFYRGINTNTIKGSGLGLVIARQFAELLGGKIKLQQSDSEKTVFTLFLPYSH